MMKIADDMDAMRRRVGWFVMLGMGAAPSVSNRSGRAATLVSSSEIGG